MSLCLSLVDYANTQLSQVTQHAQGARLRVWWIMQTPKQPSMHRKCQSLVDCANTQVIQHAQKCQTQSLVDYANTQVTQHAQKVSEFSKY